MLESGEASDDIFKMQDTVTCEIGFKFQVSVHEGNPWGKPPA